MLLKHGNNWISGKIATRCDWVLTGLLLLISNLLYYSLPVKETIPLPSKAEGNTSILFGAITLKFITHCSCRAVVCHATMNPECCPAFTILIISFNPSLLFWTSMDKKKTILSCGGVSSALMCTSTRGCSLFWTWQVTGQFSEESVSSVEPSLSTSIFLRWWMFLLGEAFLCTSFSPPTALPLLLLPGLTEIWAILDSKGTRKER